MFAGFMYVPTSRDSQKLQLRSLAAAKNNPKDRGRLQTYLTLRLGWYKMQFKLDTLYLS